MASPSESTQVTGDEQRKTLKVMYLFAGRQRHSDIGAFLRKAEKSGKFRLELMEFDIERSPDHDLTDDALWDRIFALLKEGDWVLIVSPPCNTFSRARFQHQQHPGAQAPFAHVHGQKGSHGYLTEIRARSWKRIFLLKGR